MKERERRNKIENANEMDENLISTRLFFPRLLFSRMNAQEHETSKFLHAMQANSFGIIRRRFDCKVSHTLSQPKNNYRNFSESTF